MRFVTSADVRNEQEVLAARARLLQRSLDHVHEIEATLNPDEHQILHHAAVLRESLTAARDCTADRVKSNEVLLDRVLSEEAVGRVPVYVPE